MTAIRPTPVTGDFDYETVAAGVTTPGQTMGATGAKGDHLEYVLIIPTSTSPGAVSIKDGGATAIEIFPGGASSVSTLIPFPVPWGARSVNGAWQIITGSNVRAVGFGRFTA